MSDLCLLSRALNQDSFSDTEITENNLEHVLDIDAPGKPSEGTGGQPQLLGDQLFLVCRKRAPERFDRLLQCNTVPLTGDDDRFTSAEGDSGKGRQGRDEDIHAPPGFR